VRRLVALLVIALAGATIFGLSGTSSGLSVNGTSVSNSTIRGELSAISSSTTLQCYLTALDPVSFAPGAGATISASGATAWANLRVEGIAIDQYVKTTLKFHPSAATLAKAKSSLLSELTEAATSRQYTCPGSSAAALAAMPTEMRTFEIQAQAASLDLVSKLNKTVPLNLTSMKTYYASHTASYDTICVSVALVAPTDVAAFSAAQSAGASVAALAKQYSADPSGQKGGVYGCFGPSSTSFTGVRSDTSSTPLNTFPTTPQYVSYNSGTYALFVAPTKRTVTPFAKAETAVLSDLETANATTANTEKEKILYYSAVAVDPAFGRWGLNNTGPSVFAPATPTSADVGTKSMVKALSTASSATYK
jgi:hypothetical protein